MPRNNQAKINDLIGEKKTMELCRASTGLEYNLSWVRPIDLNLGFWVGPSLDHAKMVLKKATGNTSLAISLN